MKNLFGYILIAIALCLPILIAFPQFYSNDSSGRINKEIQLNFEFLNKEKSPTVMLFFGYVGCGDICSPALTEVGRIYNRVDKDKTNVYFLNVLDTTRKDTPQSYAKGFHKDFKGVYLDSEGINNVAAELNLSIIKVNDQEHEHGNATPQLSERYHYHHNLKAGENTLGAHLVRILLRSIIENGKYVDTHFINDFIAYMTSDISKDPYTEIYIRRYFENYTKGGNPLNAAELQSNTWSIGSHGGVIRPLVLSLLYSNPFESLGVAIEHQNLTHRSQNVAATLCVLVPLLNDLTTNHEPLEAFFKASKKLHLPEIKGEKLFELYRTYNGPGNIPKEMMFNLHTSFKKGTFDLKTFMKDHRSNEVVRTLLSNACYTEHGIPLLLYLSVKHHLDLKSSLLANVNAGGDNVHRGMIMGLLLGAASNTIDESLKRGLVDYEEINQEIEDFIQLCAC